MNDKRVIIVGKCRDCPFKGYSMKISSDYCSNLPNNDKITDLKTKLENCPLELLDVEKITEDLDKELTFLDILVDRFSDGVTNNELIDDWTILSSPSIFDFLHLTNCEESLLNELIHIIKIYVFNEDDKKSISKKIIDILKQNQGD